MYDSIGQRDKDGQWVRNKFRQLTDDMANIELQPPVSQGLPPWYHPFKISSLGKLQGISALYDLFQLQALQDVVVCL